MFIYPKDIYSVIMSSSVRKTAKKNMLKTNN